jgi:hypothetical protein
MVIMMPAMFRKIIFRLELSNNGLRLERMGVKRRRPVIL